MLVMTLVSTSIISKYTMYKKNLFLFYNIQIYNVQEEPFSIL